MNGQRHFMTQPQGSGNNQRAREDDRSPNPDDLKRSSEAATIKSAASSVGNNVMSNVLFDSAHGSPLDVSFREQMERALGTSLSDVRVRDDNAAHASAASLDADAYTVGEEIMLGANAPSIQEAQGQELLAHEVVHVAQQRSATAVRPDVNKRDDSFEHEADSLSKQALTGQRASVGGGATVPGVQRQSAGSVTKRVQSPTASREEVEQAVLAYLQKAQAAQGGTLRMTEAVKTALRALALAEAPGHGSDGDTGKQQRSLSLEGLLNSSASDPADLAKRVANILPESFDRSALQKLQTMPAADAAKTTPERVKDLAEKNFKKPPAPDIDQPPSADKQLQDEADKVRAARGLPQPHGVGPISVDLFALGRFLRDLPGTVKPKAPASTTQARDNAEVDKALQSIPKDALTPPEARDPAQAGNFALASEVAADLARKLDIAQQQQKERVELRLTDSYNQVKDRMAMITAVVNIVQAVRQALPHHGSAVKYVDVYFGDRLVTRNVGTPSQ
jgi:hypothetical protein